jgi:outer membrane lipoprotein-sorting protein
MTRDFPIFCGGNAMKAISFCLVTTLVLNTCGAASLEAQPNTSMAVASNAQQTEKVKMAIQKRGTGTKAKVKIMLRNKTERKGYISRIDDISFQLTDQKTGRTETIAYDSVEKVNRPGISGTTKMALYIGIGTAAAAIILGILASKLNHS